MIYPEFLKEGSTIGITAPSQGVGDKISDFDFSLNTLKERGWKIVETSSVRNSGPRSTDARTRGKDLVSLFTDDSVDLVMSAAGGDFLYEILPYTDFETMQKHPKWLMGASDPTGILYPYTTLYDVATIYGMNAGSYDIRPWHTYQENNLKILSGENIVQKSSSRRLSKPPFLSDSFVFDTDDVWEAHHCNDIHTSGRCIGGCMDVLKDLIGTVYDGTLNFLQKYQKDGFIWYLDNFSLSAETFYRTLLQMKYAGWFENTRCILIGRVCFESSETGMTYSEAIDLAVPDIPVLFNVDIGHTIPAMTMINGAVMNLVYENNAGSISFELR